MFRKHALVVILLLASTALIHGQCIEGNCYEGNGTFLFENGDQYKGLWKKGLPFGYGVYEFAKGDVYKGSFKDGLMDGRGTYTYANGDKYIGSWKGGKMNGRGHFHWELAGDLMTNAVYEGFFKDGVPQNIDVKPTETPSEPPAQK